MDKYTYLFLGVLLGLAIAIYFIASREEKIVNEIKINQRKFSTKKLDIAMENVVRRISSTAKELKRELTEDEKDKIIAECCKKEFCL